MDKNILIFGGTFDPIHQGHIEILNCSLKQICFDYVYIVPTFLNPQKITYNTSKPIDRINMIKLATQNINNLIIEDFEINQNKINYTFDTFNYFKKKHPETNIYFLIGADQWNNLLNWHNIDLYKNEVTFIVAQRDDLILNTYDGVKSIILNNKKMQISSSDIRKSPKSFDTLPNVMEYINNNGLYAIDRIKELMSEKRFQHSLRVAYYAHDLMMIHNKQLSNIAYCAGIYHDIAKEMDLRVQEDIAINQLGIQHYAHPKVLHGYIGSWILKQDFCFMNQKIINAINRHTLPFAYYSDEPDLLTKVLYLADKLEPNRTDEDVFGHDINYFRELAKKNVDECFIKLYELLQKNLNKKDIN